MNTARPVPTQAPLPLSTPPQPFRTSAPHGNGDGGGKEGVQPLAPAANLPVFSGRKEVEERQIKWSADGCSYNTRFFSAHLYRFYISRIKRMGGHIHSIDDRIAVYDIYLTPDNSIDRQLVDLK